MSLDNIKLFFQPAYFFNPYPGYDIKLMVPLLTFFGALILASIIIFLFARRNKKNKLLFVFLGGLSNSFAWYGVIGLMLIFFRYEGIAFLSSRALLFLLILTFVFWTTYSLIFGIKKYKKTLKEFKEKKEKEKYFVRKK